MSTNEIKAEIQKLLDNVPEIVLNDLLDYLRKAQNQSNNQIELYHHLRKIISEDKELLEKLAK
jgi:site-specific recombinase